MFGRWLDWLVGAQIGGVGLDSGLYVTFDEMELGSWVPGSVSFAGLVGSHSCNHSRGLRDRYFTLDGIGLLDIKFCMLGNKVYIYWHNYPIK